MRLSVQLYTLRDQLAADLEGTLAAVRKIGLEYVEIAGFYGADAAQWRLILDGLELKVSGNHQGLDGLRNNLDGVIADNRALGNRYVIVPWVGESEYANGWRAFGKELNTLGRQVRDAGLQLAYHNHAFEFPNGLDELYAAADPNVLKAELDLAWVSIGGADPVDTLRRYASRAPLVHLKDYDPAQKPQWRPAGEGVMPWDSLLAAAKEAGVEFGVIELDESPGDPLDAVRKSFDFFRSRGLS